MGGIRVTNIKRTDMFLQKALVTRALLLIFEANFAKNLTIYWQRTLIGWEHVVWDKSESQSCLHLSQNAKPLHNFHHPLELCRCVTCKLCSLDQYVGLQTRSLVDNAIVSSTFIDRHNHCFEDNSSDVMTRQFWIYQQTFSVPACVFVSPSGWSYSSLQCN